ncbi:MAG: zinc-dependent alcohol dehydrogenase [Christensenellales bacterium]
MKALVKYETGPYKVKMMDREIPAPGFGQVRIIVRYVGICGTDIHLYKDDGGYKSNPPVTLGHEFSGVVDAVGEGVDPSYIGGKVVSETYYITCGSCFYCQSGHKNLCPDRQSIGSGVDGAMAEYVIVPVLNIHLIPDNVSLQEAAMMEPLACCVQAVLEKGGIRAGDRVLVTGPGAIGLMCLQIAAIAGARVVVAGMKKDAKRLQLALTLGAERVVYSDDEGAKDLLRSLFAPHGADVVFECSGAGAAINMALEAVRKGGRYVQVGLTGRPTTLDMNRITLKELDVAGTFAQKTVWWVRSLELLSHKKVDLESIISDIRPFEQWQEAFDLYERGEGLKFLLVP